jgi:hypothetical protein
MTTRYILHGDIVRFQWPRHIKGETVKVTVLLPVDFITQFSELKPTGTIPDMPRVAGRPLDGSSPEGGCSRDKYLWGAPWTPNHAKLRYWTIDTTDAHKTIEGITAEVKDAIQWFDDWIAKTEYVPARDDLKESGD